MCVCATALVVPNLPVVVGNAVPKGYLLFVGVFVGVCCCWRFFGCWCLLLFVVIGDAVIDTCCRTHVCGVCMCMCVCGERW